MAVESDVWLVGELLREKVGENLPSNKISGLSLVDWLVQNDNQVKSQLDLTPFLIKTKSVSFT